MYTIDTVIHKLAIALAAYDLQYRLYNQGLPNELLSARSQAMIISEEFKRMSKGMSKEEVEAALSEMERQKAIQKGIETN